MGCCQAQENKDKTGVPQVKLALLSNDTSTDVYEGALDSLEGSESVGLEYKLIKKEEDRWNDRSKYIYRQNKKHISTGEYEVTEREVEYKRQKTIKKQRKQMERIMEQRKVNEYEQKKDIILDRAIMATLETQVIAADTAQVLDDQRHQLMHIDKDLHEINEDLNRTQAILKGMTTWKGFIKRKILKKNKDPQRIEYVAPVSTKSAMERNLELSYNDHIVDDGGDVKLNALLRNVKALNQTANDINEELEEHDVMLGHINDRMDDVQPRIRQQINTINKYNKKR